jgi:repressor LexA
MNSYFNSTFYEIVGNNIKKYRKTQNDSLQSLAEKLGVTKKTIHRYENSIIKIDVERLVQIASALDITVEKLTDGILSFDASKM